MNEHEEPDVRVMQSELANVKDRVNKLEDRVGAALDKIDGMLNGMRSEIMDVSKTLAGRPQCPQPGLCLQLQSDISRIRNEELRIIREDGIKRLEDRADTNAKAISELAAVRNKLLGAWLVIVIVAGALVSLFTPLLRSHIPFLNP